MRRLFLSGISILLILSGLGYYKYYQLTHHERLLGLLSEYPVFDKEKDDYILVKKRPKHWVDLENISKYARWAIIVSEDWAFYEHDGVDSRQIKKALKESLEEGELTRGASTITQQVVKNAILSSKREISRKIKEAIIARELEKKMSKDRILEIYLNLIELGKNIYGIKQASYFYFNKHPSLLNAREGVFLAMLLPSPIKYAQSFHQKKLSEFARKRISSILVKLRQARIYNEEERKKQSRKYFYWESDKYSTGIVEDDNEDTSVYDDYLEDSFN